MNKTNWWMIVVVLIGILAFSSVAQAQTGCGYDLTWNTFDGGGGTVTGGAYTLDGTIGQADAGSLSGGGYNLNGGYWFAVTSGSVDQVVFLPLVLK